MQQKNQKIFATELDCQYLRPTPRQQYKNLDVKTARSQEIDSYTHLKMIKKQLKQVKQQYRSTLSDTKRVQYSLDKLRKSNNLMRVRFFKTFDAKIIKRQGQSLVENLKAKTKEYLSNSAQKARKAKIDGKIRILCLKNQRQQQQNELKNKLRIDKQMLKQQKSARLKVIEQNSFRNYRQVKKRELQGLNRRRNIQAFAQAKARNNYLKKINRQMQILNSYKDFADQLEQLDKQQATILSPKQFFPTKP